MSRYLNSKVLVEELAEVLEDTPAELDEVLERFEELKTLNSLHSFLLKAGAGTASSSGLKVEKGGVADLFCRSVGVQLSKMDFQDIKTCFDNYVA